MSRVRARRRSHQPKHRAAGDGGDGLFGKYTVNAVKEFQRDNPPLTVDGEVGEFTWTTLQERFCRG
ncbi:MAG: putative peptidoglycan binding domain [Actinomycetota bacterium]|nr:putative peptidoglycan binding domain [Actinomycetota bacterium]